MWHFNVSTFSILLLSSLYNGACHLNAEFQRIGTRDKKAFFRVQCKKNRGKQQNGKDQRSLKKIRDTKGIFHAKMGSIKDRNGRVLTETEDIKKRRQEDTEELYNKGLHDQDNHSPRARHPGM